MKKLLLSLLFLTGLSSNAQVTVFQDGFESYENFVITGFGNWITLDFDQLPTYTGGGDAYPNKGAAMAYQIFNPSVANVQNSTAACGPSSGNQNFDPKSGLKYAACWAGVPSTTGGATANNDWLVSPVINLGPSNNELKFWVKSLSNCWGLEKYSVGVYVGTGNPTSSSNFTIISGGSPLQAPITWEEKTFSLAAYNNQQVRIGIRCTSDDAYMFMVDDFKVTSSALSTDDFFSSKLSTFPNPAKDIVTITNNENILLNNVTITDINGRTVKTINANNASELQINVSELNNGVYFMNINTDSGKAVKKFVKN